MRGVDIIVSGDPKGGRDPFDRRLGPENMAPSVLAGILALLERSGERSVSFSGRAPAAHPLFGRLIDMIEETGLDLRLDAGRGVPPGALRRLGRFPAGRLSVSLNAVPALLGPPSSKRLALLERLGPSAIPVCDLRHPGASLEPFLDLAAECGLAKAVGLRLAKPAPGSGRRFLHPRHYQAAGARLGPFIEKALAEGIRLEFGCGFTPCMFNPHAFGLLADSGVVSAWRCRPRPVFLPGGDIVPCRPLANLERTSIRASDTVLAIRARLGEALSVYADLGVYAECRACPVREKGFCSGGCLAAAFLRLRPAPPESLGGRTRPSQEPQSQAVQATRAVQAARAAQASRSKASLRAGFSLPESPAPAVSFAASPQGFDPGPVSGSGPPGPDRWSIPYIDRPLGFWRHLKARFGKAVEAVYLPLPGVLGVSGRPRLKSRHLDDFLREGLFPVSVLLNPVVLPLPASAMAPSIIGALERLRSETSLGGAPVADLRLAMAIKERLPHLPLAASTLMDVHKPAQALQLAGVCDSIVASSRIGRDLAALGELGRAFPGKLRLIVNEGCLPGCLTRTQHFYEMGYSDRWPASLCEPLLAERPWLRLTGAWALPQHLGFYRPITASFKLAGRAALQDPIRYLEVLGAYVEGRPLTPDAIGGGPASPLAPVEVSRDFFLATLKCDKNCLSCSICRNYHEAAVSGVSALSRVCGPSDARAGNTRNLRNFVL